MPPDYRDGGIEKDIDNCQNGCPGKLVKPLFAAVPFFLNPCRSYGPALSGQFMDIEGRLLVYQAEKYQVKNKVCIRR